MSEQSKGTVATMSVTLRGDGTYATTYERDGRSEGVSGCKWEEVVRLMHRMRFLVEPGPINQAQNPFVSGQIIGANMANHQMAQATGDYHLKDPKTMIASVSDSPPRKDQALRLECAKIVASLGIPPGMLIETATPLAEWILGQPR